MRKQHGWGREERNDEEVERVGIKSRRNKKRQNEKEKERLRREDRKRRRKMRAQH